MRVIAGKCRGMKLGTLEGLHTRPTTDRMKETLFNIINFDLPGCRFLDLFSGSGGIAIEALSRGAIYAVLVENTRDCQNVIRDNLAHTKLAEQALLLSMDMECALDKLKADSESFDIIFMDPPYEAGLIKPALKRIVADKLLKESGYVIVERGTEVTLPDIDGLICYREKVYKTTTISFLRLEESI